MDPERSSRDGLEQAGAIVAARCSSNSKIIASWPSHMSARDAVPAQLGPVPRSELLGLGNVMPCSL